MDYKKIILIICALTTTQAVFCTKRKAPLTPPKSSAEIAKGTIALLGATFFAHAIIGNACYFNDFMTKVLNNEPIAQDNMKCLPSTCMARLFKPIISTLNLSDAHSDKQGRIINVASTAVSAIGSYILGKYGITKLYNVFKNK